MSDPDSEIGYGKPPKAHRFKPGTSGNPRGRPKGARGFKTDLAEVMAARVTVKENGRSKEITVVAAALKRLVQRAVSDGDLRAIERLLVFAQQTETGTPPALPTLDADDQALLDAYRKREAGGATHE